MRKRHLSKTHGKSYFTNFFLVSIKPCSKQSLVLDLDLDELTINIGNLYDVLLLSDAPFV